MVKNFLGTPHGSSIREARIVGIGQKYVRTKEVGMDENDYGVGLKNRARIRATIGEVVSFEIFSAAYHDTMKQAFKAN